jgi:hypothetical protein
MQPTPASDGHLALPVSFCWYSQVTVVIPVNAKSHRQLPLPLAGKTEISAALVQPFLLISCKAVKRKNRALTGAKVTSWSDGLFRMLANVPETDEGF